MQLLIVVNVTIEIISQQMETLYIAETENTPKVYLCEEANLFQIIGESRPENATLFYSPIIKWLSDFCTAKHNTNTKLELIIEMHLEYYNSSTARLLLKLFSSLEEFSNSESPIKIKWFHHDYDEDILEKGENYKALHTKLHFEFISKTV